MKIIAIVGQNGGCGKTTTAQNLAVAASKAGQTVVVIDLDSQPTSVNTTVALFVSAHAGVACASSTGILEAIVRANERRQAET